MKLHFHEYRFVMSDETGNRGWDMSLLFYKDTNKHNYNKISTVNLPIKKDTKRPHKDKASIEIRKN